MAFNLRKARLAMRWVAGLGLAVGVYALAGFYALPYLVQTRAWPRLSETMGGQIHAERTAFDPFRLSLTLDGFALSDAAGKPLANIASANLELDGWASLKTQTLVAKAKLTQPDVHVLLDPKGQPNYAFLRGKEQTDTAPAKPFPFLLTALSIEGGRIEFEDQSQGHGFKKSLNSLNLSLENLGTATATPARFKLGLQGEKQELLSVEGGFDLLKTGLDGEIKLHDVGLAPLMARLLPDMAYRVDGGTLSATLKYRYAPDTGFEMNDAEAEIKQLSLKQDGQIIFIAPTIKAKGISYQQLANLAELQSVTVETPALSSLAPFTAESINAQGFRYQGKTGRVELKNLGAGKLKIALDKQPLADIASLAADGLAYSLADGQLVLNRLGLDKIDVKTAQVGGTVDSITAEGLDFKAKTQRAELKTLAAAKLKLGKDGQPLAEIDAVAANGFAYQINSGKLDLEHVGVKQIALKTPTPILNKAGKPREHRVDAVDIDGLALDTAKQTIRLDRAQTTGAALAAWLERDGSLGYAGKPNTPASAGGNAKQKPPAPWKLQVERVELNDNNIVLRDFSSDPPTGIFFSHLNLLLKNVDTAPAAKPFWLGMNTGLSSNGRIALEGDIKLAPLAANLKLYVDDLSLPPFQPYVDKLVRVRIVKGMMNANADIGYDESQANKLRVAADVAIANFASDDKRENRAFANWKDLRLNGLVFETGPQRLNIRDITLTEPYLRAVLDADKKFNLVENLTMPGATPATAEPKPLISAAKPVPLAAQKKAVPAKPVPDNKADDALAVVIGGFNIHQGDADFADMSIKPVGFAIEIHALNGNIRSLSSRADVKSDVMLEGRLNEGSKVKIFGKINPFSYMAYTDLVMSFKDVNLTTLTPYSAKFAGYRIEKGKLSMELRYQLEDGRLTAANSFVLDQLQLGERVDSPDATSLPIRLAIALLKDSDGKIDIQLPITGDLTNPDVSVWGLLSNAAGSLLQKVVAAPFALMGSLMGSSGEELEAVAFAPGSTALTNPEKEQLAVVAKGLKDRPGISLEIKGSADAELDRPVLAEQDLSRQLKNAKQIEIGRRKGKEAEWDGIALSDEDYPRLFTNLYRWKNPDAVELQGLKPTESLSGNTLETAKQKLLGNWKVSEMDLGSLAQARAEAIRLYLVKDQGLPDQRIYLSDVKLTELDKKGVKEIKALLSLSGS
jgi:hypothetical protein